jgi:pyruvate/2-oxoglutarate dehydrogenase complex dihydrolipoamide acyltransferase (E2) component
VVELRVEDGDVVHVAHAVARVVLVGDAGADDEAVRPAAGEAHVVDGEAALHRAAGHELVALAAAARRVRERQVAERQVRRASLMTGSFLPDGVTSCDRKATSAFSAGDCNALTV